MELYRVTYILYTVHETRYSCIYSCTMLYSVLSIQYAIWKLERAGCAAGEDRSAGRTSRRKQSKLGDCERRLELFWTTRNPLIAVWNEEDIVQSDCL